MASIQYSRQRMMQHGSVMLAAIIALSQSAAAGEFGFPSLGGKKKEDPKVAWSMPATEFKARPGELITIQAAAQIPAGFHIYSVKKAKSDFAPNPTVFAVEPKDLFTIEGEIDQPTPTVTYDVELKVNLETFEKTATFKLPVRVNRTVPQAEHKAALKITLQLCDATQCFYPTPVNLDFKINVSGEPVAPAPAKQVAPPPAANTSSVVAEAANEIEAARSRGFWSYIGLAASLGFWSLLTPCVFPMIPITVSFFTKRKRVSSRHAFHDAAIYCAGIILTFVVLGFFFALILGANIAVFATNPWLNLAVCAIFVIMALNLLGFFEIQVPPKLLTWLDRSSAKGDGIGSLLLMGLVFSLTSFTCTAPFVGTAMVSALNGDWLWPFFGMLAFSTVFAAPFFFLALFPMFLRSLPKSGGWMNSIKVVMGFIEIAAALKFLSNADVSWHRDTPILTREMFLSIWIALTALASLYLLGRIHFPHDTPLEKMGGVRLLICIGTISATFWMTTGLFGRPLGVLESYVPISPTSCGIGGQSAPELKWLTNWDDAHAEAEKSGQPIFADFTGWTCVNCRQMEMTVFVNEQVSTLLKNFVRVKLYTDGRHDAEDIARSEKYRQIQKDRYGTGALPFYAIISSDNKDLSRFSGQGSVEEFTTFLKRGLERAGKRPDTGSSLSAAQ